MNSAPEFLTWAMLTHGFGGLGPPGRRRDHTARDLFFLDRIAKLFYICSLRHIGNDSRDLLL